jgi:RNA polymerase sigma factor (TIGR02999 family)
MSEPVGEVTRLARRWSEGDADAFDALIELVYDDLRSIAHRHVRASGPAGTLDTTALVNEAYVKLARVEGAEWLGRGRFLSFCSKAMRRILIDYARERQADKRGGARVQVPLTPEMARVEQEATDVLALDEALRMLEARNQRMARIAECRFFGGLSVVETAEALDTSARTVEREWAKARGYLYHLLAGEAGGASTPAPRPED